VEKPDEKMLLERSRTRWGSNIKMYVKDIGRVGVRWIDLAQDRDKLQADVNMAMNLWIYKMQRSTRLA
jgi:hypothetical protein